MHFEGKGQAAVKRLKRLKWQTLTEEKLITTDYSGGWSCR